MHENVQKVHLFFCYKVLYWYCWTSHIYATDNVCRWQCGIPYEPQNSVPIFAKGDFNSMQFAYEQTITIWCKPGFTFPGKSKTASITCNQFQKWEVCHFAQKHVKG